MCDYETRRATDSKLLTGHIAAIRFSFVFLKTFLWVFTLHHHRGLIVLLFSSSSGPLAIAAHSFFRRFLLCVIYYTEQREHFCCVSSGSVISGNAFVYNQTTTDFVLFCFPFFYFVSFIYRKISEVWGNFNVRMRIVCGVVGRIHLTVWHPRFKSSFYSKLVCDTCQKRPVLIFKPRLELQSNTPYDTKEKCIFFL